MARRAIVVLALVPALAAAQAPSPPPQAPAPVEDPAAVAARGHFQAGKVYFEQGDLKRALVEFREAARNVDLPQLDFNIARTHDRLGEAARAVDHYRRYLARSPQAEDRTEVEARILDLERQVGSLTIVGRIAGSAVLLDEEPVERGRVLRVTAGRHRLVASKEAHLSRTVEVIVPAGGSISVEIDPLPPPEKERPASPPPAAKPPSRW